MSELYTELYYMVGLVNKRLGLWTAGLMERYINGIVG